jgi:hypothetical protein
VAYDEESGKNAQDEYVFISSNDVKEAYDNTIHVMKNTMGDYSIPAISESYNGCLPYFSGEEAN